MPSVTKDLKIDPPYDQDLKGILAFADFSSAEETLRKLEDLRQRFRMVGDKKGVTYCRQVAMQGRLRAELISRNPKVKPQKRLQKQELATWFRVWLETPDLFQDWLAVRKESEEFKKLQESCSVQHSQVDVRSHGHSA